MSHCSTCTVSDHDFQCHGISHYYTSSSSTTTSNTNSIMIAIERETDHVTDSVCLMITDHD